MSKSLAIKIFQSLIILIPVGLFFGLLNIELVPSGKFTVEREVNEASPYLDRLLPDARVWAPYQETDGAWVQKIIGDPAFFFVHPQRSFEKTEAKIRFKNTGVLLVELGVLADLATGAYTLEPLQNLIIDNSSWAKIEDGKTVLLQREKKFLSINDFLSAMPARDEIATYHYGLTDPYRLKNYQPLSTEQIIDVSLRGSHEFNTYIKNEKLNFVFSYTDTNRQVGEDVVALVVINEEGGVIAEVRSQDDGDTGNGGGLSGLKELILSAEALPEGVYKIQMKASEDVFFRAIKTQQQKITFLNQLWLADEVGYREGAQELNLWTEGKNLKFTTRHATGAQTIAVGQGTVAIAEPYVEYNYQPPEAGLVKISLSEREDLLIKTNGHFAFSAAQYFNPDPVRLTADTDLDRLGVNYIIANYKPPTKDGEWLVATAAFNLSRAAFEDKTWKFVFSLPTVDSNEGEFLLNSIKMDFFRPPLTWSEFWRLIKTYVF